jgi:hypothetical protein
MNRVIKKAGRNPKNADEMAMGMEPDPAEDKIKSQTDLIHAYNWYNYFHTSEDAKGWVKKANPDRVDMINAIPDWELRTIGWTYRMMERGYSLDDVLPKVNEKLDILLKKYNVPVDEEEVTVANKFAYDGLLYKLGNIFTKHLDDPAYTIDVDQWFKDNQINMRSAHAILNYIEDCWGEPDTFIGRFVELAEEAIGKAKLVRKPRVVKVKAKPAEHFIKNLRYKNYSESLNLRSIAPTNIIGAKEVWIYDAEKRIVTALRGESLTVRGTTIHGWDEKISLMKKIRKPEVTMPELMAATKLGMKKILEGLSTLPMPQLNGRTNTETIILKAFK